MNGNIWGIPTVLIILVLGIALLVDLPMVLLHNVTQKELLQVQYGEVTNNLRIQRVEGLLLTPTASPSAVPSPTVSYYKSVTKPVVPTVNTR